MVREAQDGEACVLTRVLVREGGRQEGRRRGQRPGLLAREMEGVQGSGIQAASKSWKSKGTDSLLRPPEGKQPCQLLDLSPSSKFLTS